MADRTVRTIFEAVTSGAQKNLTDLGKGAQEAGKNAEQLGKDLKALDGVSAKPEIDLAIEAAEREIADIKADLDRLSSMEATPEVTADIAAAERKLGEAESSLRELEGKRAEMQVDADTSAAEEALDGLGQAGEDAGADMASGILSSLKALPIAGAILGVGTAIAGGLVLGIKQGLALELERDVFSAQTGLDEASAARFGQAAGAAYAEAWGESVAANLDIARQALQAGLIDEDATSAQIENIIGKVNMLKDLFEVDVAMAIRGVGNAMKTGLVESADEAFDLITKASQQFPAEDLLDTLNEYSNQFVTVGLTGKEAFDIIAQGMAAGARDTDIVADAVKEMGLRIREGTDPAIDALEELGLKSGEIISAFQEGGPKARDAMQEVFDALRDLKDEGGNTQEVIANLFGGPGEDLGVALFALFDETSEGLGGIGEAAGAADEAMRVMSDNAATAMEEAKRSIEIAMDSIKGALAAAFSDDIASAADWVSRNQGPLMEFFGRIVDGAFEVGKGFVEFAATALDAIASVMEGLAGFESFLNPIGPLWKELFGDTDGEGMRDAAAGAREAASALREDFIPGIEESQAAAANYIGGEILAAKMRDATKAMAEDLDFFVNGIDSIDATVTINGDTIPAEDVLDVLVGHINAEDGTVTINGDRVPADQVLNALLAAIAAGDENVTIGGDSSPGQQRLHELKAEIAATEEDMRINGETAEGRARLAELKAEVARTEAAIKVNADLHTARTAVQKFVSEGRTIYVNVVARPGQMVVGGHEGGWTGVLPGRSSGGWVPGHDPGYDNILWPLHTGGQTLWQPLAGREFVVNSRDAAYWAQALEAINSGARPAPATGGTMRIEGVVDVGGGIMGKLVGTAEMVDDFARNAPMRSRMQAGVR